MCREARQSGSKRSKEVVEGRWLLNNSWFSSLLHPFLSPLTLPSGRYRSVIPGMLEITIASPLIQGLSPLTGTALTLPCTSLP